MKIKLLALKFKLNKISKLSALALTRNKNSVALIWSYYCYHFHVFTYSLILVLLRAEAQRGEAGEAFIVRCQPFIKSGTYCPYCWCST